MIKEKKIPSKRENSATLNCDFFLSHMLPFLLNFYLFVFLFVFLICKFLIIYSTKIISMDLGVYMDLEKYKSIGDRCLQL